MVKALIDNGADIDSHDSKGWTPLMIAAINGNYAIASLLIREGCNIGAESKDGKTAREFA